MTVGLLILLSFAFAYSPALTAARNVSTDATPRGDDSAIAISITVEPTLVLTPPAPSPTPTPVKSVTAAPSLPATTPLPSSTVQAKEPVDFSAADVGAATLPFSIGLSPAASVVAGSTVSATAVWSSAPAGLPTGTMEYTAFSGATCTGSIYASGGVNALVGTPALIGSVAGSTGVTFPNAGSFSWQATYSGDANYAPGTLCSGLTITPFSPAISLSVSPAASPMKAGGSATGVATISGASTSAGGTVTYTIYSDSACTTQYMVAGNPAIVTVANAVSPNSPAITFNTIGSFYWRAVYSGDGANSAATSSCVSLVVARSTPTSTLIVSAAVPPMVAGGSAFGSVTLPGITTIAGGTVTYTVYTNSGCSTQISPAQSSTKTVVGGVVPNSDSFIYATVGTRYWKAVYSGDANNTGVTSTCMSLVVAKTTPTLSLSLSVSSPITAGTAVVGTSVLSNQTAAASGTVVYAVYTDAGCTTQSSPALTSSKTVVAGVVPVSTSQTHNIIGAYYWKSAYAGDTNNNSASSGCLALTVNKSNPTIVLAVAANTPPMIAGNLARGSATLNSASTTATGSAVYSIHSDVDCTIALAPTGSTNTRTLSGGSIPTSSSLTINVAGTVYWKVVNSGDANNNPASSACVPFEVAKRSPTITVAITAQSSPMKVGGTASGRGTLAGAINTASGTAVYTVYSDSTCNFALIANNSPSTVLVTNRSVATSARITINLAGTVYWRVVYSGDANHNGAQSACKAQSVALSTPSLALTVAATVSPMRTGGTAAGRVTMTLAGTDAGGTVTYSVYSNSSCSTLLVSPGSPAVVTVVNRTVPNSAPITINKVGTVYWKAAYSGDSNNNPAASSCLSQTVSKAAPVLSLMVAPSVSPMSINGTAVGIVTMSSGTANAGGTLTYTLYSNSSCTTTATNVTGSPGTVTVTNQVVPNSSLMTINFVGAVYWRAAYAGDSNNNSATSTCVSLVTVKKQPAVALIVTPSTPPMRAGGSATGSATLSNSTANASGTVTYSVFTDNSCTTQVTPAQTSVKSVTAASVPISSPIVFNEIGSFYWNAVYSGDAANQTATSSCISLTVAENGATSLDLVVVPDPVVVRSSFVGNVSLSGATAIAGGTVTYSLFADASCTTQLSPNQSSVVTVVNAIAPVSDAFEIDQTGAFYMNAVYSGDPSNSASASACDVVTVSKAAPSISLTIAPNPIVVGHSAVASVVVSDATSNLTGNVTYTVYTDNSCQSPVSPAQANIQIPVNGVVPDSAPFPMVEIGSVFVEALFDGDAENLPAVSGCVAISVTPASPTLSLTLSPNPVEIGAFFGAHMSLSADAINPTGTVTLQSYTDALCSITSPEVADYVVTISGGPIPDAPDVALSASATVYRQATYTGDANNSPAVSDCLAQMVTAGQLSAGVISATLSPVGYSNSTVVSTGTLVIQVFDDRETADGWSVTLIASDFEYNGVSTKGIDLSVEGFAIVSTSPPVLLSGQAIGAGGPYSGPDATGSLDEIRTLLVAESGFGAGRYQMSSSIALEIPAQSQTGAYTATLIIATSAAP